MNLLNKVYSAETFRAMGHKLVDQLAENLSKNLSQENGKVIDWIKPDDSYEFWRNAKFEDSEAYFKAVMERSIQLQHPKYIGHQVSAPAPIAALATLQGALLNSGGAVYEMSAASSTLEKVVIDILKPYFGYDNGDGIITSGGTLANLTALICARNVKAPEDVWNEGQKEQYAFMVSEEAHYCIDRAVRVMGWGDSGIIKVPVDGDFKMRAELLPELLLKAQNDGIKVLGIVGSAPTTSTGIYDDLEAIGQFCIANNLWYHIDAAHGGPAVFSKKYRYLINGCQLADSITVDAHKMMMTPSLTTMLFFKNSKDSYRTFAQRAQYLWSASDEEWFNYGKRTMECTKIMLSTRIYALISEYGIEVFEEYIDRCYDMGKQFETMLLERNTFELAVVPESNIVCFRLKAVDLERANEINRRVRQILLEEGRFYIVQTMLHEKVYLRITIMNPFTSEEDLRELLNYLEELSKRVG